jgi:hypothetical protein
MTSGTRFIFNFHRCAGPVTLEEKLASKDILEIFKKADMPALSNALRPYPDDTLAMHLDFGHAHKSAGFFTYKKGRHVVGHIYLINEGRRNGKRGRDAVKRLKRYFKPERADIQELPWVLE